MVERLVVLVVVVAGLGCGGRSSPVRIDDGGLTDAAGDALNRTDGASTDAAADAPSHTDGGSTDVARSDGPAPDGAPMSCDPLTGCQAYWCGCGQCDPAQIECVTPAWATANPCGLGCVSSCPELATTRCECRNGSCNRLAPDAGLVCDQQPCQAGDSCADPSRICCPLGGPLQACVPSNLCCCWGCE